MSLTENKRSRKVVVWLLLSLLVIITVALLYPIETEVVPVWRVKVLDEAGSPIKNILARESWQHYSFEGQGHSQDLMTDDNGYVEFPRRTVKAGLLIRAVGPILNIVGNGVHASFGPKARITVWGYGGSEIGFASYVQGTPLPKEITLRKLNLHSDQKLGL